MTVLESLHQAHVARRRAFQSRAVPDDGITMHNGRAVKRQKPKPEPEPEPDNVVELDIERLVRNAQGIERMMADGEPLNSLQEPHRPTCNVICRTVAAFYNMSLNDLLSHRRTQNIVFPRQVAMYLCKHMTLLSLPRIGGHIGGRDHTTVLHAVRKIEALRQTDERLRDELTLICMKLSERYAIPAALQRDGVAG